MIGREGRWHRGREGKIHVLAGGEVGCPQVCFHGSTEHEEERTEEVLEILKGLGELSRRMVDPPAPPPRWESLW
jgi:hypothetical protein